VPDRATVERWVEQTPDGFTFDVELHPLLSRHAAPLDALPPALRETATTTERGRVVLTDACRRRSPARVLDAVAPLAGAGRLSTCASTRRRARRPR